MNDKKGRLFVVGIGPGDVAELTARARQAIEQSEVVVGYKVYLELIEALTGGKVIVSGAMGRERERCEAALREALLGKTVAIVSSGDAGIYGMAGLVLEIALAKGIEDKTAIEIVPGLPAFVAAAALAGAPLMHDFAAISLSDLLTPWDLIEKRLRAAAEADFVTCVYNPKSKKRTSQIERAREIFLMYRAPGTPCAVVRNATRRDQSVVVTTLEALLERHIDMLSLVIIGNTETISHEQWMITPRGYDVKTG